MRLRALIPAAILTAMAAPGGVADIPACVHRALTGESIGGPTVPAPVVTPQRGPAGTPIRVEGSGFDPGVTIRIVALYGEDDCSIVGLGDQLLGDTRVDDDGRYRINRPWPDRFVPSLGRGAFEATPLPEGRYYLVAIVCEDGDPCNLAGGSAPGGPYVMTRADDAASVNDDRGGTVSVGAVLGAGAGAMVILGGLRFMRHLLDR